MSDDSCVVGVSYGLRRHQGGIQAPSAMRVILCTAIGASIDAKNLIPEEVDYTKITIGVTVMNKV
jgi:hypothetical protein